MNRCSRFLGLGFFLAFFFSFNPVNAQEKVAGEIVPNRYIIQLKKLNTDNVPGKVAERLESLEQKVGKKNIL